MVHLATIPNNDEATAPLVEGLKRIKMKDLPVEDDLFTTGVYGSKFAAEDLPQHEMPEKSMPKETASRLIKDHLSLDGNPMLK